MLRLCVTQLTSKILRETLALPFPFAYLIVSYLFAAWENSFPFLSFPSVFKGGRDGDLSLRVGRGSGSPIH